MFKSIKIYLPRVELSNKNPEMNIMPTVSFFIYSLFVFKNVMPMLSIKWMFIV